MKVSAWKPVGLLSSVLLFMRWQRGGASLRTCWSSQPFRHGCTSSCFGHIGMLVLRTARCESGQCQRPPFHPSLLFSTIAYINVVGLFKVLIYSFSHFFFFAMSWLLVSFIMAVFLLYDFGILGLSFGKCLWWRQFPLPCKLCALQR